MTAPIKVLIVDDSLTARRHLARILAQAPDLRITGEAANGQQAVDLTHELQPDVILMDIVMPQMDGLDATREIMHAVPTPVVMISATLDRLETMVAFQAIRRGALTVIQKPVGPNHADFARQSTALINTVRAMAGVRVIHHHPGRTAEPNEHTQPAALRPVGEPEIVAIAASTGGPGVIADILKKLPPDWALPILIVQHISPEFLGSMVDWLNTVSALPVSVAQPQDQPSPGRIYFAPGDAHLRMNRRRRFECVAGGGPYVPSGDVLLESIAASYGPRAVGIVLTGMGSDGARGLKAMRDAGAHTIAQDAATSIVFGMPREAAALGAANEVLPTQAIAARLLALQANLRRQTHD